MTTPHPSSAATEARYLQPRSDYLRKRAVDVSLFGMLVIGGVAAGIATVLWIGSDPNLPRAYWLVPLIVVVMVFEVALLEGAEFLRHRFALDGHGFTPPFFRPQPRGVPGEIAIPFAAVDRVTARTYVRAGVTHIYGLTIALDDGQRVVVRGSDVGEEGIRRLAAALSAAEANRSDASRAERERRAGLTNQRALRREVGPAVGLLIILALSATVMFAAGSPASYTEWAFAIFVVFGAVFAMGWIRSVRRRLRVLQPPAR